jgi:hypothetical protein
MATSWSGREAGRHPDAKEAAEIARAAGEPEASTWAPGLLDAERSVPRTARRAAVRELESGVPGAYTMPRPWRRPDARVAPWSPLTPVWLSRRTMVCLTSLTGCG